MTIPRFRALAAALLAIGLILLVTSIGRPAMAGEASAPFRVTMDLLTGATPPGVACRNSAQATSLECSPRPVVAGAVRGDMRVMLLYGNSLIEEDGRMWGAVAASRRVTWAGRDYLELTLSW